MSRDGTTEIQMRGRAAQSVLSTDPSREGRAVGCLLRLACGDALGRPVEFQSSTAIAEQYGRVDQMYGNGTHGQPAGTVTDDTDLATALARSLVETGGFDQADAADRYVAWYESEPLDVGAATAEGAP